MRTTTDTYAKRTFRWNTTAVVDGITVPARTTKTRLTYLHYSRCTPEVLRELNGGQLPLNREQKRRVIMRAMLQEFQATVEWAGISDLVGTHAELEQVTDTDAQEFFTFLRKVWALEEVR